MAGDPFGLLLRQRVIFLGGEVQTHLPLCKSAELHSRLRDGLNSRQGLLQRLIRY